MLRLSPDSSQRCSHFCVRSTKCPVRAPESSRKHVSSLFFATLVVPPLLAQQAISLISCRKLASSHFEKFLTALFGAHCRFAMGRYAICTAAFELTALRVRDRARQPRHKQPLGRQRVQRARGTEGDLHSLPGFPCSKDGQPSPSADVALGWTM